MMLVRWLSIVERLSNVCVGSPEVWVRFHDLYGGSLDSVVRLHGRYIEPF